MQGLQSVVDHLLLEPVAPVWGHTRAQPLRQGPPRGRQPGRPRRRDWLPLLGGAGAPGRLRCRYPLAHAGLGQHAVLRGQAQPERLLSPGAGLRAAAHRACKPPLALAPGPVGPCATTARAPLPAGGRRPTRGHRRFRVAAELGGHLHPAPALPALADGGRREVSRREARGRGATRWCQTVAPPAHRRTRCPGAPQTAPGPWCRASAACRERLHTGPAARRSRVGHHAGRAGVDSRLGGTPWLPPEVDRGAGLRRGQRASALIACAYASTLARDTTESCSRLVTTRRSMLSS